MKIAQVFLSSTCMFCAFLSSVIFYCQSNKDAMVWSAIAGVWCFNFLLGELTND